MKIKRLQEAVTGLPPFGLSVQGDRYTFFVPCDCQSLTLLLFEKEHLSAEIPFSAAERIGNAWHLALFIDGIKKNTVCSYCYRADGIAFADPYGKAFVRKSAWGAGEPETFRALLQAPELFSGIRQQGAEMQQADVPVGDAAAGNCTKTLPDNDTKAHTPLSFSESILYRLHVRGFTMSPSSGIDRKLRGTFDGIVAKLPYLQSLGVTSLELLPCYEFEERVFSRDNAFFVRQEKASAPQIKKINYWGFTAEACRMAPKAAYGGINGFCRLIRAVHEANMELLLDIYFDGTEPAFYVTDVLRFWRLHYGVDGIRIVGTAPLAEILSDPCLKGMKIIADSVPQEAAAQAERAGIFCMAQTKVKALSQGTKIRQDRYLTAGCDGGFAMDVRRYVKGDAAMVGRIMERLRGTAENGSVINYAAGTEGFSLMDVFSYNEKHNEANGEENRDGASENASWNCGEEGPTRKRSIQALRMQLCKNTLLLLFLANGTPLLTAGDEMGHTRRGNNNAWCQDNETQWLDWKLAGRNKELLQFTKELIRLRKTCPALGMANMAKAADGEGSKTAGRGMENERAGNEQSAIERAAAAFPPLSFHGEELWRADTGAASRQLGILYCRGDSLLYIAANMHWEPHRFSLLKLPKGYIWTSLLDTKEQKKNRNKAETGDAFDSAMTVGERSIRVLYAQKHVNGKPAADNDTGSRRRIKEGLSGIVTDSIIKL